MKKVVLYLKEIGAKRLFFGVLTLLIILGAIFVLVSRPTKLDPKFQEAFDKGSYETTIQAFEERIFKGEKDPTILKAVAAAYIQKAMTERKKVSQTTSVAIAYLSGAIRIDGSDDEAYRLLGLAHYTRKELPEATTAFKKAISLNPKNAEAYVGLGLVFELSGDIKNAYYKYTDALKANPSNETAELGIARWGIANKDANVAIERATRAINSSNVSIKQEAYTILGSAHSMLSQEQESLDAYKNAALLGSTNPHLYVLTARAYVNEYLSNVRLNNLEPMARNALAETEKALAIDPTYIYAYTTQHQVYMMLKDTKKIDEVGKKIVSLLPTDTVLSKADKEFYAEYYKQVPTVTVKNIKVEDRNTPR